MFFLFLTVVPLWHLTPGNFLLFALRVLKDDARASSIYTAYCCCVHLMECVCVGKCFFSLEFYIRAVGSRTTFPFLSFWKSRVGFAPSKRRDSTKQEISVCVCWVFVDRYEMQFGKYNNMLDRDCPGRMYGQLFETAQHLFLSLHFRSIALNNLFQNLLCHGTIIIFAKSWVFQVYTLYLNGSWTWKKTRRSLGNSWGKLFFQSPFQLSLIPCSSIRSSKWKLHCVWFCWRPARLPLSLQGQSRQLVTNSSKVSKAWVWPPTSEYSHFRFTKRN